VRATPFRINAIPHVRDRSGFRRCKPTHSRAYGGTCLPKAMRPCMAAIWLLVFMGGVW